MRQRPDGDASAVPYPKMDCGSCVCGSIVKFKLSILDVVLPLVPSIPAAWRVYIPNPGSLHCLWQSLLLYSYVAKLSTPPYHLMVPSFTWPPAAGMSWISRHLKLGVYTFTSFLNDLIYACHVLLPVDVTHVTPWSLIYPACDFQLVRCERWNICPYISPALCLAHFCLSGLLCGLSTGCAIMYEDHVSSYHFYGFSICMAELYTICQAVLFTQQNHCNAPSSS
jgi:hypothetical protein